MIFYLVNKLGGHYSIYDPVIDGQGHCHNVSDAEVVIA